MDELERAELLRMAEGYRQWARRETDAVAVDSLQEIAGDLEARAKNATRVVN